MNKVLILVFLTFSFYSLFAQESNKNVFSQDEVIRLSAYAKQLEKSILENNSTDTALIAKLKGDFSFDLYGYTDESIIAISDYIKILVNQDSINNIPVPAKIEEVVVENVQNTLITNNDNEVKDGLKSGNVNVVKPDKLIVNSVLFNINSARPIDINLFSLVYDVQLDKDLTVLLVGHTDASGSDNFNLNLSIKRATSVKRLLVNKGIKSSRIIVKGEGEWKPVDSNETEEGRGKNRRVDISVD